MGSEKRRISSDSGDAYARVVRREELQQELELQQERALRASTDCCVHGAVVQSLAP